MPYIDWGILLQSSTLLTDKFVIGIRFIGTNASNIKTFMEDDLADIYALGDAQATLRQNLHTAGFKINAIVFTAGSHLDYDTSTGWVDLLDPATMPLTVGSAILDDSNQAFSSLIGLQFVAPTPMGPIPIELLRNFRLLTEFQIDPLP